MPPDPAVQTNSSAQPSPEPHAMDSADQFPPAPFHLPEAVLDKTTSPGIFDQRKAPATSPVVQAPTSAPAPSGGSLIRRISSKASRITPRIRPSATPQKSRDGSVGPRLMRRRSDSNNNNNNTNTNININNINNNVGDYALCNSVLTDSEPDAVHEQDEVLAELQAQELPFNTPSYVTSLPAPLAGAHASSASSSTLLNGAPTIPNRLKEGTSMRKVSKKNKAKEVTLQLQVECYSDKITWDKSRPNKCIHVDDIRDIRKGGDIRQYRLDFGFAESDESRWFTIMYAVGDKSKVKAVHLIAPNDEMFNEWTETLDAISRHRQFAMVALMNFTEDALREYWLREHSGDNDELDFAGIERVCKNLHINASSLLLHGALQFVDGNRTGRLNFEGFLKFIKYLNTRNDVNRIYHQVASEPSKGITMKEFLAFLERDQREEVQTKRAQWETVFVRYSGMYVMQHDEQMEIGDGEARMSDVAFASFLTSFENSPIKEAPAECKLDRPMNEYYISSSHNTYLMGRQIYSESTTEGYIAALINGCRCVEVDCWDGPNGQPVVNHGRTFTTAISFQEAIATINKYAFHKSRLPLWISFEVHCSPPQQAVMAQICTTTFGSRLVTEPLSGENTTLPSPSELVGRILIKVKQAKAPEESAAETSVAGRKRGSSFSVSPQTPVIPELMRISHSVPQTPDLSPVVNRPSVQSRITDTIAECEPRDISSSDNESVNGKPPLHHQKSFTPSIIPVLGDLGVYCAGVKFKGFDTKEARKYNHIFSFMESSFSRYSNSKEDRQALDRHNMRYLMRVYPNQTRVTSNNFDPLVYWRRGVQMAALNWQTFDLGVQINRAMFEGGTDTSGYVLKPKELREIQVMPDGWQGKRERKRVTFEIEVISARQLMRPTSLPANKPMNPYVEIEIYHSSDKRDKKESISSLSTITDTPLKMQTKPVTDNGFNPTWKGEKNNTFRFQVTTKYPDLIFVRWVVKLAPSGETYAVFTAKLSNLKQGYRTLPLLSPTNGDQYLFSTLFCRIHKNDPESILLDYRDDQPDLNKLRGIGIGRNVFARSTSPKASLEKQLQEN